MNWGEFKSKYSGPKLSEVLIIDYLMLGNYVELGKKYNASKDCVSTAIKANLEEVKAEKPYLYELYKYKVKYNKENGARLAKERSKKYNTYAIYCEGLKHFEPKMFETLPAQMDYDKEFLNLMLQYNTGDRTGNDLVKIAAKHGTRVYRVIKNRKVFI